MDAAVAAYYVLCLMQFLLLLSALLSALTGVIGASRHAEARTGHTETQVVAEASVPRQVLAVAVRLVELDHGSAADVPAPPLLSAAPAQPTPLDLVRLNE
jgi:hypothetical protein